ncbi:MAG: hypothetical protein P4K80_00100 [Acidobacteriaceae bacterium]|nr:hypothetical protein [Acidobacteriaceae bacterium]
MRSELLAIQVEAAARAAGLEVLSSEADGSDASSPEESDGTAKFLLALAGVSAPSDEKTLLLELSERFEFGRPDLKDGVRTYLAESARRLRNPRPDCLLTLHGIPLSFGQFGWPFHESTSGADTSIVHGEVRLEDGGENLLHARVAASMTVTFREVLPAPEQPFAESFVFNAVRKTMDQGQLELVKSGNRQPVSLTTRFYSPRTKTFSFNDTTEEQRRGFLAGKLFWLSGVLGASDPVWLLDPRDAQYLNSSVEDLRKSVAELAVEGLLRIADDAEFASPTAKLMERKELYTAQLAQTLAFIKPSFNESMRHGLTNM